MFKKFKKFKKFTKFTKFRKFISTFSFFFSKKTDNKSHKSILIIEGPSAIGLVDLLRDREDLPITFYVPLQPFSIFKKVRSKNQSYYYPGLFSAVKSVIFGCIKYLNPNRKKDLITLIELELICTCFKNSKNIYKSVVIFNERMPLSAFASEWARSNGIMSCCVQHGAVVENYFPVLVDKYFVWNNKFGDIIRSSRKEVETVVTGRLIKVPEIKDSPKLSVPLVILQPSGVSIPEEKIISNFVEIIEECIDVYGSVVLRPHPNDNNLNKILNYFPEQKNIRFDTKNLDDSLSSRYLVISLYSTVLLEAINFGSVAIQYIDKSWYKDIFYRTCHQVEGRRALNIFLHNFKKKRKISATTQEISPMFKPNSNLFLENIIF